MRYAPAMFLRLIAWVVFVVLLVVFLPLLVLGALMVTYKQLVVSRRLGASQTGIEVINGRWTMDWFGIRPDPATVRLLGVLPNTSILGLQLVLFPLWAKYKLSGDYLGYPRLPPPGGAETMADLVIARTVYFDRILGRVLPEVEQFVLLGAGYDTRAYGPLVREGVTLYLSEHDVRKTLRGVREHAAPGSVLVADIYGERFVRLARGKAARKTLEYTNEGVAFGLSFARDWEKTLRDFLDSERLALGESYFMGRTNAKGPFMVVAEVTTRPPADRRQGEVGESGR